MRLACVFETLARDTHMEITAQQQPQLINRRFIAHDKHYTMHATIQLYIQQSITISNLAVKSIWKWSQKRNGQ